MLKNAFTVLFLACATLSWGTAPFGIFNDSVQPESAGNKLWQTILSEQPITLKLTLPDEEEINRSHWEQELQKAFNQWFVYANQFIQQSGRAKEFADILPILKKGLYFGPQGLEEKIIILNSIQELRSACQDKRAHACASRNTYTIILPTNQVLREVAEESSMPPVSLSKIMTHEFGHQLGLIDQNPDDTERQKNRVLPKGYSTNMHVKDTVMSGSYEQGSMGCDDVDALINVIDLHRAGAQGSRKGKKWKSFCQGSNDYFTNGKNQQIVDKYHIQPLNNIGGEGGTWLINLAELQSPVLMKIEKNQTLYPKQIISMKEKIIEQNSQGAPLKTQGPNGEIVYYDYFQGIMRQVAIQEDSTSSKRLLWVRGKHLDRKTNRYINELYFGSKGNIVIMKWMKPSYFYYKEWGRSSLAIELTCQQENKHLSCEVTKDTFTHKSYPEEQKNNSVLLGEMEFTTSALEQELFRKKSINQLINLFQDLPEK